MTKTIKIVTILAICCLSMATMAQEITQVDSLSVEPVSVSTPLDVRAAKAELKQARAEMKEARADLKQAKAEERKKLHVLNWRHEIRIGWGDQLFESLMWHNPTYIVNNMPTTWSKTYKENFTHHQHLWIEYQYYTAHWFSLGAMLDFSEVGWTNVTRNGTGKELSRSDRQYFYNVVVMPTIRFTYINHPNANLYSGLGIGMDINGGTEKNAQGQTTEMGLAVNLTLIGTSINFDRWFFCVDLGGLTALRNKNSIYMAFSRMINVGIGVRL